MPMPMPMPQAMPQPYIPVDRQRSVSEDSESIAKRNPLIDLVETEKVYGEQLTLVIRVRVTATDPLRCQPY